MTEAALKCLDCERPAITMVCDPCCAVRFRADPEGWFAVLCADWERLRGPIERKKERKASKKKAPKELLDWDDKIIPLPQQESLL